MSAIQVKRRNSGTNAAPASLKSGEIAYNAVGDVLYVGKGDDGAGNATVIQEVAGRGFFAMLASPAFTGAPTAPTAGSGANTNQIATTAFVKLALDALINAAPGALDTLKELADAIGDDANYAATVSANLAAKAPLISPALTGTPTAPTAATNTNTNQVATTAFAQALFASVDGGTF